MWTITNPSGGVPVTFESLNLADPQIDFRVMGVSTARVVAHRDYDSEAAWWEHDAIVTIYRSGLPYYTGRVQDCPDAASAVQESRTLVLVDAWQDLEEVIYREAWGINATTYLYPRAVLGMDSGGGLVTTGEQIEAVIDYAITQGVELAVGTIDAGVQLWPSEVRNTSCEAIIIGELRFHPDWVAWIDHSTETPTFHARVKSALDAVTLDIAAEVVESQKYNEVKRTVPNGVSIIYESASTIDGEVYRTGYADEAGDTSRRRVIRAMIDLEGVGMSIQKSRIQTRTLPTNAATMTAWMKKKYPVLAPLADGLFEFSFFSRELAATETEPDPINELIPKINVETVSDLPRELVHGSIEDWMRVEVGQVVIKYDFFSTGAPTAAERKILANFEGSGKTISVTATNATTKIYKGISSFTAGDGKPTGLAAAVFAAATEQQFEGEVVTAQEDVPAGRWHGKRLTLVDGATTLVDGAVIHSAAVDVERGKVALSFGPMPYLSAGDFLELQRILNSRPVKWYSLAERTSNTLGATGSGSAQGDNVGGFNHPNTTTPPGGGLKTPPPFFPTLTGSVAGSDLKISMVEGFLKCELMDDTSDAAGNITVTAIPSAETVTIGKKYWVTASETVSGVITAAAVASGTSWPSSTAPKLIGGDDQTGTAGTRIWRLCEVVADGDEAKLTIHRTGHIQHEAARLLENLKTTSYSSGEGGRIVKKFHKETGTWQLRTLVAGTGVEIEEDADIITITSTATGSGEDHPWKVTPGEDATHWVVAIDPIYGHGATVTATGSPVTSSGNGFIYLKLDRESASRVPDTAVLEFAATVPTSTDAYQYRAIAYITGTAILQIQFEEIRIQELMIVENGAYKMGCFDLASRNTYALP